MKKPHHIMAYGTLLATVVAALGFYAGSTQSIANANGASTLPAPNGRIAVVDVFAVSKKLLEGDRYAPARDAMAKERNGSLEGLTKELTEIRGKIEAAGQNSPDAQPLIADFQGKAQFYRDAQTKAQEEFNGLLSSQFAEGYRLVVESANAVAKKQGFSYVVVSKVGPVTFESKDFNAAGQEVLSRPMILFQDGDDITGLVMAELKLDASPAATDAKTPAAKLDEAKPEEKKPEEKK